MTDPFDPTDKTARLQSLLTRAPVLPVLSLPSVGAAEPLAEALVAGGLPILEVTLRTDAALEAIARMARVAGAVVGAGTILTPEQYGRAVYAGAQFIVSPGLTADLLVAAASHPVPYLPGIGSVSEAMTARAAGCMIQKLFPAKVVGGIAMLKAIAGPLPDIAFCPTGGVTAETAPDYLALPNVLCVGGTWVAPPEDVAAGRWTAIRERAAAAAA